MQKMLFQGELGTVADRELIVGDMLNTFRKGTKWAGNLCDGDEIVLTHFDPVTGGETYIGRAICVGTDTGALAEMLVRHANYNHGVREAPGNRGAVLREILGDVYGKNLADNETFTVVHFVRIRENDTTRLFAEVAAERVYQQERWGNETDDTQNTPWHWCAYIAGYAAKWMAGTFAPLNPEVVTGFRAKMIKTATLAFAAAESVDRQRRKRGHTFYEVE